MRTALELAMAFKRTEFASVERRSAEAGIAHRTASELYVQAMEWAENLPR
jgi:c-di-GMP-related signal transduction protein